MPGLNGTGPQRTGPMSGRGIGRCRTIVAPAQEYAAPVKQTNGDSEPATTQVPVQNIPVCGRGRGGVRCGCGRSFGFGGGRRLRE
ncbi:MAG: DUF5320 domain-containing protein [Methanoregula sp.]